jgi:hypothetical protein
MSFHVSLNHPRHSLDEDWNCGCKTGVARLWLQDCGCSRQKQDDLYCATIVERVPAQGQGLARVGSPDEGYQRI